VCYLLLDKFTEIDRNIALLVSISLIIMIRLLAVRFKLALPGFRKK
jgi:uncharacterized membrane protein YeiH